MNIHEARDRAHKAEMKRSPFERLVVDLGDEFNAAVACDDLQGFFERVAGRIIEREVKLPVSVTENSHAVVVDRVDQVHRMVGELQDLLERSRP